MRIPHSTILFSFFKKLDQGLCCKYYSKLIWLLLLFLWINVTDLSKCSSSVPSSNAITIQQSILRDSVNTIHFKTIQGAVSKLFYHLCFYYYLGIVRITPWTVILKTDKEGSLLRFNATSNHPCYYFFQVDSTEKYIYAGFWDGFIGNWMYRLTTDSGTFVDAIDFG